MSKPVQLPINLARDESVCSPNPPRAASVAFAETLEALKTSTRQAVVFAQSARRALAGQLPAAAGGMAAGDVGSFGT